MDVSQLIVAFGAAWATTLLLTPAVRHFAGRLKLLDHADGQRKLHPAPIPLGGGVVLMTALALVAAAMCGGVASPAPQGWRGLPLPIALTLSAGMICLVGCCDDLVGLRVRWKLLGQVLATLPLVLSGHRLEQLEIGGYVIELGWWAVPLSIGWLVAGANALNFVDGVDGLASTIGIAIACSIGLIAFHLGHLESALLCAILAGGLGGFVFYNWQPATIYLGDAGSMVIGLWLAALAASGSETPAVGTRLVVLAALVSVPLADIALAVVRRTLSGRQFWLADRAHIHHRLLDRGFTVPQIVGLMASVSMLSGCLAFAAAVHGRELLAWGGLLLSATWLLRARAVGQAEFELAGRALAGGLLNLLARFSTGPLGRDLPSSAELEASEPSQAWARFIAELDRRRVVSLDLTCGDERGAKLRYAWAPPRADAAPAEGCTIEACYGAPGRWCRMRVALEEDREAHPLDWLAMRDLLRLFGRHWAARPQDIPATACLPGADEIAPTLSLLGDARRRAA